MHNSLYRFDNPIDVAEHRYPDGRSGVELYRAHIVHHSFEAHIHEGFGVGAIESGVERFRYSGTEYLAPPESILLMNPCELHTGRAETVDGWRYRMLYIEPGVLADISGDRQWCFTRTVVDDDRERARRVSWLLDALWQAREALAFDSLLLRLVNELRPHAEIPPAVDDQKTQRFAPVLDYMREHLEQRISLEDLAVIAGLSPFHFLRRFQAQYHATPQQLLMAYRLSRAKRLLTAGETPADVAAASGLTDQAHLTRAFASRYGVTPGRYQRQLHL